MPTTFTLDDLPGVTFTATLGSAGEPGLPSNWISIVGTTANPDPEGEPIVVTTVGFQGP